MSDHITTALDMLHNADDLTLTREHVIEFYLRAAQVHSSLAVAEAIERATVSFSVFEPSTWPERNSREDAAT
jgi:hypothetical protein